MAARDTLAIVARTVAAAVLAAFVAYYVICCYRCGWCGDFDTYLAAVRTLLREGFLHPQHESMPVSATYSFAYTPYIVSVALVAKLVGAGPYQALEGAAVWNVIAFVASIVFFFRTVSMARESVLAAAFFLVVNLGLRDRTYHWSSETSFDTLQYILAYPSFLAWSLFFCAYACLERFLRGGRRLLLVAVAFALWACVLSHTITGSFLFGVLVVRALVSRDVRKMAWAAGAVAAALALTLAWPYGNVLSTSNHLSFAEHAPFMRHALESTHSLYLLAVPCAIYALARRRHVPLMVCFLATVCAYLVLMACNIEYGARYVFFSAAFAQIIVADVAAALVLREADLPRWAPLLAIPIFVVVGVRVSHPTYPDDTTNPITLAKLPPSAQVVSDSRKPLQAVLPPGAVVLARPSYWASRMAALTGAKMVVVRYAVRVPDYEARVHDTERFFAPATPPSARADILRRYHVTRVALLDDGEIKRDLPAIERQFGRPVFKTSFAVVWNLKR